MKEQLKEFDQLKVDVFINYVQVLKTELDKNGKLKNYWVKNISDDQYISVFKKVYSQGLCIDGDSITLSFRGKLVITYDYHAYKNKVKQTYPETIFDFGLLYDNDKYDFHKKNGKIFSEIINGDVLDTNRKIKGAYGIIKNRSGEFIETINLDDIEKIRKTAKTQTIWNAWEDRMILKSVIKRICSVNFKDIVKDIEEVDNENNDPNRAVIDESILLAIAEAETQDQLNLIYKNNIAAIDDREAFIKVLSDRKKEIANG